MITKNKAVEKAVEKPEAKISSKWNIGSNVAEIIKAKAEAEKGDNNKKYKSLPWFMGEINKKYSIRFLPLVLVKEDYSLPWFTVKLHRNLIAKNKYIGVVCPKSVGVGDCPVCEWVNENYADAKEKNDTVKTALLNKLYGQKRHFSIIFNRGTQKVEKFEYSEELKNQITADISEENPLEFTNLLNGFDGRLLFSQGPKGKKPSFMFSENPTPLASSDEEIERIVNEMKEYKDDIMRLVTPMSYEKINELLHKFLAPVSEDGEDDDDDTPARPAATNDDDIDSEDFQQIIDAAKNDEVPF
jgi:hypothetical protein